MEKVCFTYEEEEPPSTVVSTDTQTKTLNLFSTKLHGQLCFESTHLIQNLPDVTLKINQKTKQFINRFYPGISYKTWMDWRWQVRNAVKNLKDLSSFVNLSLEEENALISLKERKSLAVTPYYLSLVDPENPMDPIRKCVIPVPDENIFSPGEAEDPLSENDMSPVPGIVHRYPDRVLFLATEFCSTLCRYCTRSRIVMKKVKRELLMSHWSSAIDYIKNHPEIRDVLVSGGDPFTLGDSHIELLLRCLRSIPHIEIIRFGTKVPAVLPYRITPKLCKILKQFQPVYISIHFTHPDELTTDTAQACSLLADSGIPLGSQTVLLKDINDSVEVMKKLMQGLLKIRVRPYYIYQCDPVIGSRHFRTPVRTGLEIIKGLRGFTSGYAVPNFVIDAPGGGGKIPLLPDYYQGIEDNEIILKNYKGELFRYPDYV